MSAIENIKAVNSGFGFTFPKEVAFYGQAPKDWKEANTINKMKSTMYVPLLKSVQFGQLVPVYLKSKEHTPMDKVLLARSVITEVCGTILGGIVLAIIDIFFTILVKPFLNLAVWIHNKKLEKQAKAKEIEEQAARNISTKEGSLKSNQSEQRSENNNRKKDSLRSNQSEQRSENNNRDSFNSNRTTPTNFNKNNTKFSFSENSSSDSSSE